MKPFTIKDFFSKQFEEESTKILVESPSFFSVELMKEYIHQIIKYGLSEFISFASEEKQFEEITSKDITQLSSIDDSTINICQKMKENYNPGMDFQEIAIALHGEGDYASTDFALSKYGENQVKTARQLGLTTVLSENKWYLTSIGYVYPELKTEEQNKLLSIILLRDPFYSRLLCSLCKNDTSIREYMNMLAESTIKRRIPSCLKLIEIFLNQCNNEGIETHQLILT